MLFVRIVVEEEVVAVRSDTVPKQASDFLFTEQLPQTATEPHSGQISVGHCTVTKHTP